VNQPSWECDRQAFEWYNGQLYDLGALPGNNSNAVFQVNANGVGVGMSETSVTDPFTGWPADHAVIFKNGHVTDLGTLPGGYESQGQAITDNGQVSGFASNGIMDPYTSLFFGPGWNTQARTFVWQNGVMRDIGTLGGNDAVWNASNARGDIAGASYTDSALDQNSQTGFPILDPFLWRHGQMIDLGTLGGTLGFANWLNNADEVVGQSDLAGDQTAHPFLWNGKRMIDLGTLGGTFGVANWISNGGEIVGGSLTSGDNAFHATLWKHGTITDLTGADSSHMFLLIPNGSVPLQQTATADNPTDLTRPGNAAATLSLASQAEQQDGITARVIRRILLRRK
jgi:probable HAF family extracellular repeat protein